MIRTKGYFYSEHYNPALCSEIKRDNKNHKLLSSNQSTIKKDLSFQIVGTPLNQKNNFNAHFCHRRLQNQKNYERYVSQPRTCLTFEKLLHINEKARFEKKINKTMVNEHNKASHTLMRNSLFSQNSYKINSSVHRKAKSYVQNPESAKEEYRPETAMASNKFSEFESSMEDEKISTSFAGVFIPSARFRRDKPDGKRIKTSLRL